MSLTKNGEWFIPDDDDYSLEAIKAWLSIGQIIRFRFNNKVYSLEDMQDGSWLLWVNKTDHDSNPILSLEFPSEEELFSYEYLPGKTLNDIWRPEMLYSIE